MDLTSVLFEPLADEVFARRKTAASVLYLVPLIISPCSFKSMYDSGRPGVSTVKQMVVVEGKSDKLTQARARDFSCDVDRERSARLLFLHLNFTLMAVRWWPWPL
jgi:hypothetical protein